MSIEYRINHTISGEQFRDLLSRTSLGARRPLDDSECMQGMAENGNLLITAWQGETLVGVARSVTDFHFACYLSDLAVDENCQKMGIGKTLMKMTKAQLKPHCMLVLIAAPAASEYYGPLGMEHNQRCWVLPHGADFSF